MTDKFTIKNETGINFCLTREGVEKELPFAVSLEDKIKDIVLDEALDYVTVAANWIQAEYPEKRYLFVFRNLSFRFEDVEVATHFKMVWG